MKLFATMGAVAALGLAGFASADVVNVDLTGLGSNGAEGDATNTVILVDVGAGATVQMVEWTGITVTGQDPSTVNWVSDVAMGFGTTAGTLVNLSENGDDLGLPDDGNGPHPAIDGSLALGFDVAADGMLRIELYERSGFDEIAGADNIYNSGNLAITYIPAPGALALVGLAGLIGRRRRA